MSPRTAHQEVVFFVVSVITAAWLWMLSFRVGLRPPEWVAITVLMWIPGLVAVGLRLVLREGFGDVGWKLGHWRFWLWAYLGPLVLASLSILLGVMFGKVAVAPLLSDQTMLDALWFRLSWPVRNSSAAGLLCQRFLAVATVGMVPGYILAFGEELGWRGYLLPRLVRAAWPFPLALTGLVWGVWHFPLFFLTDYAHGAIALSLVMFTLLTVLFGVFIGWLRLASDSVFVATMAHASFNGFVQSFYGTSFGADHEWFWIGDYGVFVLVPYMGLVAWLCWSGRLDARRAAAQSAVPRSRRSIPMSDIEKVDEAIERAAQAIRAADALLVSAGAGMGVDSGLPDFRGTQGFWRSYPAVAKLSLSFEEMANPVWFQNDPHLAWAFYGHRLDLYRQTKPHRGFRQLLDIGSRMRHGCWVFTSNVDGHFQKAGFPPERIVECHGSIHHFQCSEPCGSEVWEANGGGIRIDEVTFKALEPLPKCRRCSAVAHPNILMFGDRAWLDHRTRAQQQRFMLWVRTLEESGAKFVVVELGAGTAIPTVRLTSERLAERLRGTLVRINPREATVPNHAIGLPLGASEGVQRLSAAL